MLLTLNLARPEARVPRHGHQHCHSSGCQSSSPKPDQVCCMGKNAAMMELSISAMHISLPCM